MPPQPDKGKTPAAAAATSTTTTTPAPHNPIAKVIWDGSIPIQFTWDKAEAAAVGSNAVESFFYEASRCSYFSLLTSHVRKHFVDMALHFIGDDAEVWYDYEGTPLKWHYPIGLLYDIHGLQASSGRGMNGSLLPWKITVHFQNFPADKLIKSQAVDSCQDYFMSMIKEADYLRNGSTKKVMNMSKSDQTQLWDGLWSNNYDRFWGMNHKLMLNDGVMARSLPIRIYLPENCPVMQDPVSPVDENSQPRTLRQVLHHSLPDLFPLVETGPPVAAAMIHGITPSLDTSAIWVSQNMSYPDNFLHLVIIIK
ncbi:autophagy protein Apg5-domain-containing protein [Gamsiella multidivaricata]|uniref:autophagy protein Apg5-domain-containing protein n=1 Tax=Gamsiella multidivaricata TaxID=101098 RepID=UPI00221EF9CC|nr:autophagy protein Apg5-domain-containing protein [Gamsiella multidivaricata]KAG0359608.1 autophagy protein 5 [Gamsiella multidivaricata]KAI7827520.1 autophagy protein Apg5-domain-containing protein [Gamsiella multidivaricata]